MKNKLEMSYKLAIVLIIVRFFFFDHKLWNKIEHFMD